MFLGEGGVSGTWHHLIRCDQVDCFYYCTAGVHTIDVSAHFDTDHTRAEWVVSDHSHLLCHIRAKRLNDQSCDQGDPHLRVFMNTVYFGLLPICDCVPGATGQSADGEERLDPEEHQVAGYIHLVWVVCLHVA